MSSLSNKEKKKIVRMFATGKHTKAGLGRTFGVSPRTIGRVLDAAKVKAEAVAEEFAEQDVVDTANVHSVANYQIGKDVVNIIMSNGDTKSADRSHKHFDGIVLALITNDPAEQNKAVELIDKRFFIESRMLGSGVTVKNHQVLCNGEVVKGQIVDILLKRLEHGDDASSLVNFISRAMKNPSNLSLSTLYDFISYNDIRITRAGMIVGWKYVNDDYKDRFSGTFDNSVGAVVEMERSLVDTDPSRTCSSGLHVGSIDYVKDVSGKKVLVSLDPADAVCCPKDYHGMKLRACKYTVIRDVTDLVDTYYQGEMTLDEVLQEVGII